MKQVYRSPYEAYPFLSDPAEDLRCDFEILTDRITGRIGELRAACREPELRVELARIGELVYHANPTLRTRFTVTQDEIEWLKNRVDVLREATAGRCERFVLPQGSGRACIAHVLRAEGKEMARLIYRHMERVSEKSEVLGGQKSVPTGLIDFACLLSGYFFHLALHLNALDGIEEMPYESRNYR